MLKSFSPKELGPLSYGTCPTLLATDTCFPAVNSATLPLHVHLSIRLCGSIWINSTHHHLNFSRDVCPPEQNHASEHNNNNKEESLGGFYSFPHSYLNIDCESQSIQHIPKIYTSAEDESVSHQLAFTRANYVALHWNRYVPGVTRILRNLWCHSTTTRTAD